MDGHATRRHAGVASKKARRRAVSTVEPATPLETNTALVERLRGGDRLAWNQLLERYERLIYAVPRRCGLSAEDAADVFQDVLHAFLKGLPRIRDAEALPAWFLNTAFRFTMRRRRANQRMVRPATTSFWDHLPDPAPDPVEVLSTVETAAEVYEAVARLQAPCRRFLSALFLEDPGATYRQVAERLRMPVGSLGPTRKRCLNQLLVLLEKRGIKKRGTVTYGQEPRKHARSPRRKS